MTSSRFKLKWSLILIVLFGLGIIFLLTENRLSIETDIVASLPQGDPIIADARTVISRHPLQDRVVIDLGHQAGNSELLLSAGEDLEKRLTESRLFKAVGLSGQQHLFSELLTHVVGHFPVLFSEQDLRKEVEPLLAREEIRRIISEDYKIVSGMEGIGQADLIARDPLGFKQIVFKRLAAMGFSNTIFFEKGKLLSEDKKHLLIIAEPVTSGYDTNFSRKVTALMEKIGRQLNQHYLGQDVFTVTHVGAYRAALDNESLAKKDARRAVLISTAAIALLLIFGFPRPWIGLLALLPAIGGSVVGLFVYSLFQKTISILSIGFGSAIISFTVDYGIAYLLFLDRSRETRGLEVTKEVWPLGLLAMLTTAVSFIFIFMAGFPALTQLGVFAALGVFFTFIFVHAIYPFLFPVVPPAKRDRVLPLQRLSDRLAKMGVKGIFVGALLGIVMLSLVRLDFRVDMQSLNTITPQTQAAEKLIGDVWGNVTDRIFLVVEGKSIEALQKKEDRLAAFLEAEMRQGIVKSVFIPSLIFPGEDRAKQNFQAWRAFWTPERLEQVKRNLRSESSRYGFVPGAFSPFFSALEEKCIRVPRIPEAFFPFLGIKKSPGEGWIQSAMIGSGPAYHGETFYHQVVSRDLAKIFDPALFSQRLGALILNGFIKVTLIVAVMTFLVALLYFLHFRLTFIALLPTLFSLVCTFGTLRLLRQSLGIPVIMVAAVVIGMGTDYALYFVRAYQRYRDEHHPSVSLIRLSVLMSLATTIIGFGVLALSGHALLRTAGLALALGIGYSYLGTILFVPPLLKKILVPADFTSKPVVPGSRQHFGQTLRRYRNMEPYPRLFARFKLLLDPMFPKLAELVGQPQSILDIGSGYGVPAAWLLEIFPKTRLYGVEPDWKRVLFSQQALGDRGKMAIGAAPAIPDIAERVDTVLLLDMLHYLNDRELEKTLERVRELMTPKGKLIIRATILDKTSFSWMTFWELTRLKWFRIPAYFRSIGEIEQALNRAEFRVILVEPTPGRREYWFIALTD